MVMAHDGGAGDSREGRLLACPEGRHKGLDNNIGWVESGGRWRRERRSTIGRLYLEADWGAFHQLCCRCRIGTAPT